MFTGNRQVNIDLKPKYCINAFNRDWKYADYTNLKLTIVSSLHLGKYYLYVIWVNNKQ